MKLQEMIETGETTFTDVENAMVNMKKKINELEHLRQLDMAEIVRLRRMIGAMEGE